MFILTAIQKKREIKQGKAGELGERDREGKTHKHQERIGKDEGLEKTFICGKEKSLRHLSIIMTGIGSYFPIFWLRD